MLGGAEYWTYTAVTLRTMGLNYVVSIKKIYPNLTARFLTNVTDVFTKCQFVINGYAEQSSATNGLTCTILHLAGIVSHWQPDNASYWPKRKQMNEDSLQIQVASSFKSLL